MKNFDNGRNIIFVVPHSIKTILDAGNVRGRGTHQILKRRLL